MDALALAKFWPFLSSIYFVTFVKIQKYKLCCNMPKNTEIKLSLRKV